MLAHAKLNFEHGWWTDSKRAHSLDRQLDYEQGRVTILQTVPLVHSDDDDDVDDKGGNFIYLDGNVRPAKPSTSEQIRRGPFRHEHGADATS